jgi:hypothetical protein
MSSTNAIDVPMQEFFSGVQQYDSLTIFFINIFRMTAGRTMLSCTPLYFQQHLSNFDNNQENIPSLHL